MFTEYNSVREFYIANRHYGIRGRGRPVINVEMHLGKAGLEERFPDWETLLEFRDSIGKRDERVRFMLREEDEYSDEYSDGFGCTLDEVSEMERDALYRFETSHLMFGATCLGRGPQYRFPPLPISHLFHRSDALKFVRLSFGHEACESFRDLNSTAKSLSFFGCTFDASDALSHLIRSSANLTHLETAKCKNIMGMFGAQAGKDLKRVRSLVVGAEQLVSPCGQKLVAADTMCTATELAHFSIAFHGASNYAVHTEPNWTRFLQSVIYHCPNLKEISFCPFSSSGYYLCSEVVEKSMLDVVQKLWNPRLEEVNHNFGLGTKRACEEIEKALHDRHRFSAVRLSPCREALLAAAIKGRADQKDYMYTLLAENADVLQTNCT